MLFTMLMVGVLLSRPEVSASQGMAESGMNQFAVGRCGEQGAYQVQERHWGRVPRGIHAQTKQNERIVDGLLQESAGDLEKALCRYNGAGAPARKYAKRVMRDALQINMLGWA